MSARIRAGSRFKGFLCFVSVDVIHFRIPQGVLVLQVEDRWIFPLKKVSANGGWARDLSERRGNHLSESGVYASVINKTLAEFVACIPLAHTVLPSRVSFVPQPIIHKCCPELQTLCCETLAINTRHAIKVMDSQ
jgi:hypothetical protein